MALTRTEIINTLIKKHGYKSYLEIGVNTPAQPGYNWGGVECEYKAGVDPNVYTTHKMTSDEFFEKNRESVFKRTYDFIFIDGLHLYEQVYKDVINALEILNDGGTIMLHDCNPTSEITQRRVRASDAWHGDVWKAFVRLRIERDDLEMYTIDADEGCGIIQRGKSNPYDVLCFNRKNILNLVHPDLWKSQQ